MQATRQGADIAFNVGSALRDCSTACRGGRTSADIRAMAGANDRVAFLGIGTMGHGMAASALRAGIQTVVWDRHPEKTASLVERGATVADSPADAARQARIVVTMVPDADAVLSLARDQGMLAALAQGAIWAQMSTIGLAGIGDVIDLVTRDRPEVLLLDAPVSGLAKMRPSGAS